MRNVGVKQYGSILPMHAATGFVDELLEASQMRSKNRRGANRGQRNQAHKRTKTKPMVQGIPGPTTSPVSSPGFLPSVQMDRPDASMRVGLIVVPEFAPTDMRSLTPRPPEGSRGIYTVKFVLSTPGRDSFLDSINVADVMRSGNSLLQAPRPDISQVKLTMRALRKAFTQA
jgi:hypothetical protein